MIIIGVILAIAGIVSTIYGFFQNNSIDAQMESLFSTGSTNPGTIFIILGIVAIVLGAVLTYVGYKKSKK